MKSWLFLPSLLAVAGCGERADELSPPEGRGIAPASIIAPDLNEGPVPLGMVTNLPCGTPAFGTLTVHRDRECIINGFAGYPPEELERAFVVTAEVSWTPTTRSFDPSRHVVFVRFESGGTPLLPEAEWPNEPTQGFFELVPFDLTNPTPGWEEMLAADPMHMLCPPSITVLGGPQQDPILTDSGYITSNGIISLEDLAVAEPPMTVEEAMAALEEMTHAEAEPPVDGCPRGSIHKFF